MATKTKPGNTVAKPKAKAKAKAEAKTRTRVSAGPSSSSHESERFRAAVDVGHGDTHYVVVPFDPRTTWAGIAPVKIPRPHDPRGGKGWLVSGTVNGVRFDGHVGHRYGTSYLILDAPLLAMAKARAGDDVDVEIAPLTSAASRS